MNFLERLVRHVVPHKDMPQLPGAPDGLTTRFTLLKCRWLSVYLHRIDEPTEPSQCHDHPWHFWTLLLAGGYWERIHGRLSWRGPGTLLYRTARTTHNVITRHGRPSWSLVVVSRKVRPWEHKRCD